jgi:hypothetical protein
LAWALASLRDMGRLLAAAVFACAVSHTGAQAAADEVSLRLGGDDVRLDTVVQERLAVLARDVLRRCGPNTAQHPDNFGSAALGVERRWKRLLEGSRLRVRFAEPFTTESYLGGKLVVAEALIGLEDEVYFVGPGFTHHGDTVVEHLNCEYLAALELACLGELAPYLPARYRETCAKFERDAAGRLLMPAPDIAPSCS